MILRQYDYKWRVVQDTKFSVIEENVKKNEKQQKNLKRQPNCFSLLVLISFNLETIFQTY